MLHSEKLIWVLFGVLNGSTQGCLYDLSLRGSDNDQITIFSPLGLRGGVSYVKVLEENDKDEAAIETVITSAKGGGIYILGIFILLEMDGAGF